MIVLDEPYVSEPLIAWLEESQHPVLDNAFARSIADGRALNLVSSDEAVRRIDAGERVYTNSENALAWIVESAHNESLSRAIGLFKERPPCELRWPASTPTCSSNPVRWTSCSSSISPSFRRLSC